MAIDDAFLRALLNSGTQYLDSSGKMVVTAASLGEHSKQGNESQAHPPWMHPFGGEKYK
ncbi:MAG: hypothetical protein ACE37D_21620 [Pseudomonadales bacterium]